MYTGFATEQAGSLRLTRKKQKRLYGKIYQKSIGNESTVFWCFTDKMSAARKAHFAPAVLSAGIASGRMWRGAGKVRIIKQDRKQRQWFPGTYPERSQYNVFTGYLYSVHKIFMGFPPAIDVLGAMFKKYGLMMHPEKARFLDFTKPKDG